MCIFLIVLDLSASLLRTRRSRFFLATRTFTLASLETALGRVCITSRPRHSNKKTPGKKECPLRRRQESKAEVEEKEEEEEEEEREEKKEVQEKNLSNEGTSKFVCLQPI